MKAAELVMSSAAFCFTYSMQISAKRILFLCVMSCVLIASGIGLAYSFDVYHQATTREVSLDSNPGFGNVAGGPIEVLATAVRNDKLSARFRIYWGATWASSCSQGSMLYDRRRNTFEYDDVTTSRDFPPEHSSYSVVNVTDDIIRKVSNVFDGDLPEILPQYGCHVQTGDGFSSKININQKARRKS